MPLFQPNAGGSGGGKGITLNDKAGNDEFCIKDADGFKIFCVDSNGNVKVKGRVQKTTTIS